MQTVFSTVLPDVPRAAVIWLALLAVAATVVAALIVRPDRFRSVFGDRISEAARPSSIELAEQAREHAREQSRYAQEVAVAASRAAATAERRRAEWLAAQEEVEEAWRAYEAAEEDVRRLAAAASLPLPRTVRTPAEYADRERWLHRAALNAQWRKEITVQQLSDILGHRGWDPRRHPVEQELLLRRLVLDNLRARQQAAVEREQAAWRAAELAAAAAGSLRDEAYAATRPAAVPGSSLSLVDLTGPEATRELPPSARAVETTRELTPAARGRAAVPAY
ncbi:hypothetical protein GCE86_28370 [Micromonospora terminaliae]|uniref:AP2/ERF domain-containing protein n=1 Tax=Micromonospora terminaliae TaxID=1914461 RepID=A0AAJ3DHC7_9ACTN|nr:hypothetical protein [Micromonospora terminaliae]NES26419.1 hypothetical protein [Micromonospora terminaliae]QGL50597.1 hypothetical protein GCE86_28370 [Micromonospora terminaliae]